AILPHARRVNESAGRKRPSASNCRPCSPGFCNAARERMVAYFRAGKAASWPHRHRRNPKGSSIVKIKAILVRFYRSFSHDYLRRHHQDAKPEPWEMVGGKWFPYVRLPLDPEVTTIVGANESGK